LLGIIVVALETLRLAGVLGSGNVLPPAIAITFPLFWLVFFLWKASSSERPAVILGATTFFLLLNRTSLVPEQITVPLAYSGAFYLVYSASPVTLGLLEHSG
jgi:hypothetical protein